MGLPVEMPIFGVEKSNPIQLHTPRTADFIPQLEIFQTLSEKLSWNHYKILAYCLTNSTTIIHYKYRSLAMFKTLNQKITIFFLLFFITIPVYSFSDDSNYIKVTPYINQLSKQIKTTPTMHDRDVYDRIMKFILIDYNIFKNKKALREVYFMSPSSIENTNMLLKKTLQKKLSLTDKSKIKTLLTYINPRVQDKKQIYLSNKKENSLIASKILKLESYQPLMIKYPKNYIAFRKKNGFSKTERIHDYLMYQRRYQVLKTMLKKRLRTKEKNLLKNAIGYPLTQNYWHENEVEATLTPEARDGKIYKRYIQNVDYPFSFTAHEILTHKIASGCTHAAISFMALAKALGYNNVRLINAINNRSYNNIYCKEGKKNKPIIGKWGIDSHKVVLTKINDKHVIIDTTHYPLSIIDTDIHDNSFTPFNLIGKDICLSCNNKESNEKEHIFRIKAVGNTNNDYLRNYSNANDISNLMTGGDRSKKMGCGEYPMPISLESVNSPK